MKKVCSRKDCKQAGKMQPFENFYPNKRKLDGRSSACIECENRSARLKKEERKKERELYSIV